MSAVFIIWISFKIHKQEVYNFRSHLISYFEQVNY